MGERWGGLRVRVSVAAIRVLIERYMASRWIRREFPEIHAESADSPRISRDNEETRCTLIEAKNGIIYMYIAECVQISQYHISDTLNRG